MKKLSVCLFLFAAAASFAVPPHRLDPLPDSEFFRIIPQGPKPEDKVRLLKLSNKGLSGKDMKPHSGLPWERQAPRPALLPNNGPLGKGTLGKRVEIPIEMLDESGVPRNAAEIRVGIPFPKSGIYNTDNLQLRNENGSPVPAAYGILSKWPDGSLRSVLLSFSVPLKANEKKVWTLCAGSTVRHTQHNRLKVEESADGFLVKTDCLKAFISKKKFSLLSDIEFQGKKEGSFSPDGIVLVDENGKKLTSSLCPPDDVAIEEMMDERVTIRVGGILGEPDKAGNQRYCVRLRFKTTLPQVRAEISIINGHIADQYFDFDQVYFDFQPNFKVDKIILCPPKGSNVYANHSIRQLTDREYVADGGKARKGQLDNWIAAVGKDINNERIAVGLRDLALRWPKGVSIQNGAVRFEMLPPLLGKDFGAGLPHQIAYNFCEGKYRHTWGMAFAEEYLFDFSTGSFTVAGAEAGMPVIAVLPPSWYEKCGVMPGANAMVPGFQEQLEIALAHVKKSQALDRETGYLNLGDWYGERRFNWGNNEYDTAYTYFLMFVMTGNREFYRQAIRTAHHQADTDSIHAFPDTRYLGGDNYHSVGHTGSTEHDYGYYQPHGLTNGFANNGHTWVAGMLAAWELAGDSRSCDMARLSGEQLCCQAKMSNVMPGAIRVMAWQLVADCVLFNTFHDAEYVTAANQIFEIMNGAINYEMGGIWAREKKRIPGKTPGQTIFMLGIGGQSMICYHRATGDPRAAKAIITIANWMRGNFETNPEYCYTYDQSWDHKQGSLLVANMNSYTGTTLMYAALLTGDAKLKECSDKLLSMTLYRGFGVKKDFNMALLFIGEWMKLRKEWAFRHPGDEFRYDRNAFSEAFLTKQQVPGFHARNHHNHPINGLVQLKADKGELRFVRNYYNRGGNEGKITLKDADGKVRAILTIPAEKDAKESQKQKVFVLPVTGKAGEMLKLEIADNGRYFWDIPAQKEFAVWLKSDDPYYMLRRPNLRRYYFTVPQGTKSFKLHLLAFNPGFISAAVRRPDGTLAAELRECNLASGNVDASLEGLKSGTFELPVKADVAGVWSVDYSVSIDGGLSFEGIPSYISVVPETLNALP